jgi:hypothetical protein
LLPVLGCWLKHPYGHSPKPRFLSHLSIQLVLRQSGAITRTISPSCVLHQGITSPTSPICIVTDYAYPCAEVLKEHNHE